MAAEPIADPTSGEILVMPGELITRDMAKDLSKRGVNEAVLTVNDQRVKVFSNGMVNMADYGI